MVLTFLIGMLETGIAQETSGVTLGVEGEWGEQRQLRVTREEEAAGTRLEFSHDLLNWHLMAASELPDWTEAIDENSDSVQFYRASTTTPTVIEAGEHWSDQVQLPATSKFTILLDDPTTVYFQDVSQYPFHYQFATEWLPQFQGLGATAFDAQVLHPGPEQQAIVGSIFRADDFLPMRSLPYAVQFLGGEGYPPETLRYLIDLVSSHVTFREGFSSDSFVYVPTERQFANAVAAREELLALGIEAVDPTQRSQSVTYVPGWAMGRLKYVASTEIAAAFRTGALTADDILITDRLPAELPLVRGIVTVTPATPNSHVLILAKANRVPAGFLQATRAIELTRSLEGQLVALEVNSTSNSVRVSSLADSPPEVIEFLTSQKVGVRPAIMPIMTDAVPFAAPVASANASDVTKVGGKAANFSKLSTVAADLTPSPALAFTFSLWEDFLRQPHAASEKPLGEAIAARLAPFEDSLEISALADALEEIQTWIRAGTFSEEARSAVTDALAAFDPNQRIRFRSSTNVEDTEGFVGAGLYDSFSGCLADDLDDDDTGPSQCDASREEERGVFRAIRKVFASFYNLNAYFLRRTHQIDEEQVGMAILVHRSFPDEVEAANGVATVSLVWNRFTREKRPQIRYVSQPGADSTTNPHGNDQPEIVVGDAHLGFAFIQRSSLLRSGRQHVLLWSDHGFGGDYNALAVAFVNAYQAFVGENISEKVVEFEYKKLTDGSLVVKQARIIPGDAPQQSYPKAAVVGSSDFVVLQNQHIHVLTSHRLKMHLHATPVSQWYEPGEELTFHTEMVRIGPSNAVVIEQSQAASSDGMAKLQLEPSGTRLELEWTPPTLRESPLLNLSDLEPPLRTISFRLNATHDTAVMAAREHGGLLNWEQATTETAHLRPGRPDDPPAPGSRLVSRHVEVPGGWTVDSEFYWFGPDSRFTELTVGYTFALDRFKESRITGLTTEPIVLTDYFSQTYQAIHHNFGDVFLFEPGLSSDLTDSQRRELEAQNVRAIFILAGKLGTESENTLRVQGLDGNWRSEIASE